MRFLFFGDCMFGREAAPFDENPFRYVASFIREADFIFFNLETVISPRALSQAYKEPKVFNYQTKGVQLKFLRKMTKGTIFASVVNNHSLDYGVQGLRNTEKYLEKINILYTRGKTPITRTAKRSPIANGDLPKVEGSGVTFLSATDHCGCDNLKKWGERVWVIDYNNLEPVLRKIRRISQTSFIVFSIHWGGNWVTRISPKIKQLGRALIDAGVSIVFGHSAHHIPPEPIEFYRGGLIIYGLGDFINDYAVNSDFRSDEALMCTISNGKVSLVPVLRTFVNSRGSIPILF